MGVIERKKSDFGAAGRNRTGKGLLPRDFKSLVSTNFTTAAYLSPYNPTHKYFIQEMPLGQALSILPFLPFTGLLFKILIVKNKDERS